MYTIGSRDSAFGRITRPSLKAVSEILSSFQTCITVVYDAKGRPTTEPPKKIAKVPKHAEEATAFQFGFSTPGSLIVNLVLTDLQLSLWDRGQFFQRRLRDSLDAMYAIARVKSSE